MPSPVAPGPGAVLVTIARADRDTLRRQRAVFLADPLGLAMLEAMPAPAMVLNTDRQIVAVNRLLARLVGAGDLERSMGLRPGEALGCVRSADGPGGCGTGAACATCGALKAILECLTTRGRAEQECRIRSRDARDGGALDLRVHATHLVVGEDAFVVFGLADISGEKRRDVLERAFFDDLLDVLGGMRGLTQALASGEADDPQAREDLRCLSGMAIDEIEAHREMLAAERGELADRVEDVDLERLLHETLAQWRHHPAAAGRRLLLERDGTCVLHTDAAVLRRVLGSLIRNALEASPEGGVVTVGCEVVEAAVTFTVHNAGVMPRATQVQVFQRSFSTKDGRGRGVGTYSARLFTERHLGGHVGFASTEDAGTVFLVTLPRERALRDAA